MTSPSGFSGAQEQRWLITRDGVRLRAVHLPGPASPTALVVVHGFAAHVDKEANRHVVDVVGRRFPVVALDLRGHGRSSGLSTLGGDEVADVAAGVRWARALGYRNVVTVGFSMGAAIVVRHAGLEGGVDAVVAVSGPAFWNYRGTPVMRRLHFGVENPGGRAFVRHGLRTRVIKPPWPTPYPPSPAESAAGIPPTPFLVVHGSEDAFFPDEHPRALVDAADAGATDHGNPDYHAELWLERFGHAEAAIPDELLDRVCDWVAVVTTGGDR